MTTVVSVSKKEKVREMLRGKIVCHLPRRASLKIDPFLRQPIYLFLVLEMLSVRVYSGKQKPLWVFQREVTECMKSVLKVWEGLEQQNRKEGPGGARRILNTSEAAVPLTWSPQVCAGRCAFELLSRSGLDLPRTCHFYQRWKVQRVERPWSPESPTPTPLYPTASSQQQLLPFHCPRQQTSFSLTDFLLVLPIDRLKKEASCKEGSLGNVVCRFPFPSVESRAWPVLSGETTCKWLA